MPLSHFVDSFAWAMSAVDVKRPQAANARTGIAYQPGIGPHTESQTVSLVIAHMAETSPVLYSTIEREVPYPSAPRSKCDLRIRVEGESWIVEAKMLRVMGDNGKPNDNILMHILSPYSAHRSALTDCEKLVSSGFEGRKAVLIFGYEYEGFPMEPALWAFETLARAKVRLSPRYEARMQNLVHPVHETGRVVAWEAAPLLR